MANRLGFRDLFRVAPRALGRYTGTLLATFIVQTIIMVACVTAIVWILWLEFGALPLWDDAVDGDLVSLMWCLRHGQASFVAIGGVVFGAILLWQLASWFLAGGIYGVLANRPEGRGETARCFGASGTTTYLAYVRLALCAIPGWLLVITAFAYSYALAGGWKSVALAVSFSQLAGALLLMLGPPMLIVFVMWTISDYARVELTLRGETHQPSVLLTYMRTVAYVAKRPTTLIHAGIGWLGFLLVTIAYAYFAQGHPMYGAEGAVTLFVIRQGVALARTAIRFGVLAGQVELGKTRPLPPLRVKVDAKTDD